jgi:hypothetical protein
LLQLRHWLFPKMKRCLSAIALCLTLLVSAAIVLVTHTRAKESPLKVLLDLPAPPPPNPIWSSGGRTHDEKFYDQKNPPPDNAPIEDLIDYWEHNSAAYRRLYYKVKPSDGTVARLVEEARRNPDVLSSVLGVLPPSSGASDVVKEAYDRAVANGTDRDQRSQLKNWLTQNTPLFASDVERGALKVHDSDGYLTNQEELLTLSKVDFDRAKPIIDRLQNDNSQPVSQVLAKWALYRRAIESDSLGDVDRYRDELIRIVEDRSVPYAARDLANDALVQEKEWPGRDEWFYSLMSDETFVGMPRFTGITSLPLNSPPDKYVPKMVELLGSSSKVVRTAAAKNLLAVTENQRNPVVIKALLPWLENPAWINEGDANRSLIVSALQYIQIPESVPGLLKVLDERVQQSTAADPSAPDVRVLRSVVNAMNTAAERANIAANTNAANSSSAFVPRGEAFPYRYQAISALAMQKDARAVPALRRVFNQVEEYQRTAVVSAIFACHGFSAQEQLDALEAGIKLLPDDTAVPGATPALVSNTAYYVTTNSAQLQRPIDIKTILASLMLSVTDVDADLVRLTVARIQELDKKDPVTAATLRRVVVNWQAEAIDALILSDLKAGVADPDSILRLLARRKELREKLPDAVYELRSGAPIAAGIAACLLEDENDYDRILDSPNSEAKTALFACGRLVRAHIPIAKVAASLHAEDRLLQNAAERFLESEDSPEARSIVLSLHPGEARILGARAYFEGNVAGMGRRWLWELFGSDRVSGYEQYIDARYTPDEPAGARDKKLQDEVKTTADLLGVYAYENNIVRIYADRVMFSWSDDASRYRERQLTGEEFARLKEHLVRNNVDDLKPFLGCQGGCPPKELTMLGRNGGRRVFVHSSRLPDFFAGLEKIFAEFKLEPSVLKYELSKSVPGLEILMADDDLAADTVWAKGSDIRVLVSSRAVREKVESDVADAEESVDDPEAEEEQPDIDELRAKREWEGYSWRHVGTNGALDTATNPAGFERPPLRDPLPVPATETQWKARAGDLEIRSNEEGLYKVSRGKLTKFKDGNYESPVVTPNGRWVVAAKYDDNGYSVVRINLLTGKEFTVDFNDLAEGVPVAFVPGVNKVLITSRYYQEYETYRDREAESTEHPSGPSSQFSWLDPETGLLTPAIGELRPLADQSFRPLEASAKPNEFWAALPANRGKDTLVGLLDIRTFKFSTVVKVPKISFDSMDMWVDEPAGKIYFIYEGHLLALPLSSGLRQ